jgi:hypothetical protein
MNMSFSTLSLVNRLRLSLAEISSVLRLGWMLGDGERNDVSLYCVSVSGRGILLPTSLSRIFRCSLAAVDGVSPPPFTPLTYLTLQVPSKPILWYPPPLELLHLDHALSTVPAQCVPGILFLLRGSVLGVPAWPEEMSILLSATRWEVYAWK